MALRTTRRGLLAGLAGTAGMFVIERPVTAWSRPAENAHSGFALLKTTLVDRFERFVAFDKSEIETCGNLKRWQTSYDELVGAADAMRDAITDDAPGRDELVEFARMHVMPPCERAVLYWLPVQGMSDEYARLATAYFNTRRDLICCLAARSRQDTADMMKSASASLRALQAAMPRTRPDRIALRRVIETLNNNDAVHVSIVRSTLEPHEAQDFRSWARSCGGFTCTRCEAWLSHEGAS